MFRPIPGYPKYEIGIDGTVRRLWKTREPTVIKPAIKSGRYEIRIRDTSGKRKTLPVHKLMQRTYMPPPEPGQVVYHKNGDRLDNWLINLDYICKRELGRKTGAKSKRKPVAKLDADGNLITVYSSAREAARKNFMSYQTIIDRCNGKRKSKLAPDGYQYIWDEDYKY